MRLLTPFCQRNAVFIAEAGGAKSEHLEQAVRTSDSHHQVADTAVSDSVADDGGVDGMPGLYFPYDGAFTVNHQALGTFSHYPLVVDFLHFRGR